MERGGGAGEAILGSAPAGGGMAFGAECPHRLAAKDFALSRRRHGFESRWGHEGQADTGLWSSSECSPPCQGGGRGFKSPQARETAARCVHERSPVGARRGSSGRQSTRLKTGVSAVRIRPSPQGRGEHPLLREPSRREEPSSWVLACPTLYSLEDASRRPRTSDSQ